jgi:hypothetical protein
MLNKPPYSLPTKRSHRRSSPELGAIEKLIDQARALRLELCRLSAYEPLAESARAGAEALTQAGLSLEKIAELLVGAQAPRKRSHHRKPPSCGRRRARRKALISSGVLIGKTSLTSA